MKEFGRFAELVFSPTKHLLAKSRLPGQTPGRKLTPDEVELVAKEALQWAKANGVTHYTFWVQPLTNRTIEKYDAFSELDYTHNQGRKQATTIDKFNGKILLKGEADGSSIPHGGLRGTPSARAYIVWDHLSNMFIRQGINRTLCIPAMLFAHTGQVLDEKTFLLRASEKLKNESLKLLHLLGETDAHTALFSLGVQQEFFIVKKKDFEARVDLHQTGTALYGALPPYNQQLSDHYYGRINNKIYDILNEAENELLRLGVPIKTKHKEVAVNQYEISCYYAEATESVEHNLLTMQVLNAKFDKHGYTVLFSEKPFKHGNGSGKHCNWSLQFSSKTNKYENLFEPGSHPERNTKFLLFLLMTLKAVQENAGLVKASITTASNQRRLGGHQAPPSIISVFLGSYVDRLLNCIEKGEPFHDTRKDLGQSIPGFESFLQDNTDRNRTCPFAFTGNKFEFRAVGSNQNVSFPMTVVAGILTKEITKVIAKLQRGEEAWAIIKQLLAETKKIRFEGDGYSKEWREEAAKRGLPNLSTAKNSFEEIRKAEVLIETAIFTKEELAARYNVMAESYCNSSIIDAETICLVADQTFIPKTLKYLSQLVGLGGTKKSTLGSYAAKYHRLLEEAVQASEAIKKLLKKSSVESSIQKKLELMVDLRKATDALGEVVTELELILPKDESSPPQLIDILNKY